ncbi:MAG: hypothetical protein PHN49_11705 [Candidatus Omnitrophica bacterium]|nr:hypothetical protein [Candidatus Omnitrophota bacterium]
MIQRLLVLFVTVILLSAPSMVYAASPWMAEKSYGQKVEGKLDFGLMNFLAGWTEIYNQPRLAKQEGRSIAKAIGTGFLNAAADTVGGLLNVATFLIPVDIPLPHNGVDIDNYKKLDPTSETAPTSPPAS